MNYLQQAIDDAKAYRDRVLDPQPQNPYVTVTLTVVGPDNLTRVPCGDATFPRCEADEFTKGVLTMTAIDDGFVVREYQPGEWIEAVAYDAFGHLSYMRIADLQPGTAAPNLG